jgi:prepilin-type N-terminal cleavage/methylation domain-containing protein
MRSARRPRPARGFTVVELLIVIVIIGILAAIAIVAYGRVQLQAASAALQSDLKTAASSLELTKNHDGQYPGSGSDLPKSEGTTYQYTSDGTSYCLTASSNRSGVPNYYASNQSTAVREGVCPGHVASAGSQVNQGNVTTIAGNSYGHADGTGSAAGFEYPYGIVAGIDGYIYIADMSHTIRRMTTNGVVTTIAGSPEAMGFVNASGSAARFQYLYGIAQDAAGNLYVGDSDNNSIRKVTPSGTVTTLAGSGAAGAANGTGTAATFSSPRGVAVDANGNVYVADNDNCRVRKITPAGVVTTFAGSSCGYAEGTGTSARFSYLYDLTVDANGNIYVADPDNQRIRKITSSGVVTTLAGSGSAGFANGTGASAQFAWPSGVAVDAAGNVYVADTGNERIRKITPSGVVTTIAGSGQEGFADGIGGAASFTQAVDVTVDANGVLYVADENRIRKIQ